MAENKENKYQLIKDPIHGSIELHPLLSAIIKTRAFQRLKYLQQLSGLYHVYPGARHTRYEHSIGVGYLAGEFAKQLIAKKRESESEYGADDRKRDEKNILCIQVAGLCHDLGHGPFSHLFDSVIKDHCSIDTETMKKSISHEELSTLILEKIIFEDENVKKKFHKYFTIEGERKIEIKKMMNMIHRSDDFVEGEDLYLYEIVANKATGIDVDKWDYFIRDCHYMGLQHEFDYRRLIQLSRICEKDEKYRICYSEKEVTNILGMFRTRCSLHHKAYKHKKGIAANNLILEAIEGVIDVPLYESETKSIASILLNLKKALEKYLQEEPKSDESTLELKEGLEGYLDLNDGVIHLIKNAKISENGPQKVSLEKAQELLKRLDEGSIPHRIPSKEIMDEIMQKVVAAAEDPGAAAEDPEPAFKMLERFLKEKMPSCEKFLGSLSKKASEKWLQSAIDKEINATKALANFFEANIQEELLLKTAILEVMDGKVEDVQALRNDIRKNSKDEYVFFKEVEFSYGSESKDVNPLDEVLFYFYEEKDGKSERKIMKGSEYKDESLHLFTPRKYYLKEYWWYTSKEPGSKDFDKVKKKIAERLFKELS